jgi:hypothetical protein
MNAAQFNLRSSTAFIENDTNIRNTIHVLKWKKIKGGKRFRKKLSIYFEQLKYFLKEAKLLSLYYWFHQRWVHFNFFLL